MDLDLNLEELIREDQETLKNIKVPYDVVVSRAQGSKLFDSTGKEFIDFTSASDDAPLGYGNDICYPKDKEFNGLDFVSSLVRSDIGNDLKSKLSKLSGLDNALLTASTYDTKEASLDLIKAFGYKEDKNEVIYIKPSANSKNMLIAEINEDAFSRPYLASQSFCFAEESVLKNVFSRKTIAVIIDPYKLTDDGFVVDDVLYSLARELTAKRNAILYVDHSEYSVIRTPPFNFDNSFLPDIVSYSKGLAGNNSLGCVLYSDIFDDLDKQFLYKYSKYSGVAVDVASKQLDLIKDKKFLDEVSSKSNLLSEMLINLKEKYLSFVDINQKGLLAYVNTDFNLCDFIVACCQDGLILEAIESDILKLSLPLSITKEEMAIAESILEKNLNIFCASRKLS